MDKILDFGDVLLREQDAQLLEGPHWLNDQVISFWFEYLGRGGGGAAPDAGAAAGSSGPPGPRCMGDVLLLPPATCFLLLHAGADMAAEVLAPLQPQRCGLVLLAVNDNPDVDAAAGGSHWTLLAYHRASHTLRHYDSAPGGGGSGPSTRAARRLAAAVAPALAAGSTCAPAPAPAPTPSGSGSGSGACAPARPPRWVQVAVPPQANGHDCGVYVLVLARALCGWRREEAGGPGGEQAGGPGGQGSGGAEALWAERERGLQSWLTPRHVSEVRGEVARLVRRLQREQGR